MSLVDDSIVVRPTDRADAQARAAAPPSSGFSDLRRRTGPPTPVATALGELASSDFAIAITALQRGIKDIEELHDKCARLRSELSDAEDRQRARLLALTDEILHWQDKVGDLADQYQSSQLQLQTLEVQQGLTRETAAREQKRAETAERRLLSYERLVLSIHDQILSAVVKDRCDTSELTASSA